MVAPCGDGENGFSVQQEILANHDGDHDGHADIDFCSPLCSCHCCHSHITTSGFLSYAPRIPFSNEFFSFYSDHLSSLSFSIWQPPKIA
tara:strand:- start:268 stop:534 length:267 start_codon:yes stop_codon:yes gene_type:complete